MTAGTRVPAMAVGVMLAVAACSPGGADSDEAREPVGVGPMTGDGVASSGPQGGGSDGWTASQAPTGAVCPPASAVEASVVSINPLGPEAGGSPATEIRVLLENSLTTPTRAKVQLRIRATETSGSVRGDGWGGPGPVSMSEASGEFTVNGLLRSPPSPALSTHVVDFFGGAVESATAQVVAVVDDADSGDQLFPGSDSSCL